MKTARPLLALVLALLALAAPTRAERPSLAETSEPLKNAFQAGGSYTLRLTYTDKDGDRIDKAQFIDESSSGRATYDHKSSEGDPESGQTVIWQINGFEKGGHHGYFLVTNKVGETVRFPEEGKEYAFKVENVADKWIVMGVGLLICFLAVPFLAYLIFRSVNKQGNPSSAARGGLMLGIVAALALFIYEFIGVYDPLVLALGALAGIALFIIVLTRR